MLVAALSRWLPGSGRQRGRDAAGCYAAIGDVILYFDDKANVVAAQGDAASVLGVEAAAIRGSGFFARIHVADRPAFLKAVSDAARGGGARSVSLRVQGAGNDGFLAIEARFAGDEAGGAIAVLRDVSDVLAREEELSRAKFQAEELSVAKDRFIATISHELRTPLNAIIGFSEILGSDALGPISDERRKEYAKIIRDSGDHLLEIVNMLLDMSKLESGTFEVEPEPFDLRGLLNGVCDMMALRAAQSDVDLKRNFAEELTEIVSDRRACRQILINLVNNAIKFTPAKGSVTVRAARVGGALDLVVEDTGVGIPAEDLPRLGSPFFQAKSSYDRPYEGTGLGLSVVRRLVGLLGGAIVLESGPRLGTMITVRLPLDGRGDIAPGVVAPILTVARTAPRVADETPAEPVRRRA